MRRGKRWTVIAIAALTVVVAIATWQLWLPRDAAKKGDAPKKSQAEHVQSQVREMLFALYNGDVETVLKRTHPKVINMLGGRAKAEQVMESVVKSLATSMKLEQIEFPAEPTFLKGIENEFVIVPTKSIIVAANGKRAESLNFQFGARSAGNSEWTYIEGSRVNRENVSGLFPDFPSDYVFPATYRKLLE